MGRVSPKTKKRVSSWMACAQLCRERVGCRYWTWYDERSRDRHTCVTMTDAANLHAYSRTVSGNRDCREELRLKMACPANQVNIAGQYHGKTTENVKTWEDCAKLCQQRASCRYWSWHHGKTPHLWLRYKCHQQSDHRRSRALSALEPRARGVENCFAAKLHHNV